MVQIDNQLHILVAIAVLLSSHLNLMVFGVQQAGQKTPVEQAMEKLKVVPDLIKVAPKQLLIVKYGKLTVDLGNKLTPAQTKPTPTVTWKADSSKLYFLCLEDADAPNSNSQDSKQRGEFSHWLVGNIPGADVSKGDVLASYIAPAPPPGAGFHRYTFLTFEQPWKLTFTESELSVAERSKFRIAKFAKKYKLGNPITGNVFLAETEK